MKSTLSLAMMALGLAGCATQDRPPPIDVVSALALPHGQHVEVRGFLRYGDDAHGLWQSEAAYRDFEPSAAPTCMTLWNAHAFRRRLGPRNRSTVTISGEIFVDKPLGEDEIAFGRCNDVGLIIERIR